MNIASRLFDVYDDRAKIIQNLLRFWNLKLCVPFEIYVFILTNKFDELLVYSSQFYIHDIIWSDLLVSFRW